jgi:hypothetical protein
VSELNLMPVVAVGHAARWMAQHQVLSRASDTRPSGYDVSRVIGLVDACHRTVLDPGTPY